MNSENLIATTERIASALTELEKAGVNYRVSVEPEQAVTLCERLLGDDGATSERTKRFIEGVNAIIPKTQIGDLRAQQYHRFELGREGSRAVFVDLGKAFFADQSELTRLVAKISEHAGSVAASAVVEDFDSHILVTVRWD